MYSVQCTVYTIHWSLYTARYNCYLRTCRVDAYKLLLGRKWLYLCPGCAGSVCGWDGGEVVWSGEVIHRSTYGIMIHRSTYGRQVVRHSMTQEPSWYIGPLCDTVCDTRDPGVIDTYTVSRGEEKALIPDQMQFNNRPINFYIDTI